MDFKKNDKENLFFEKGEINIIEKIYLYIFFY